MQSLKEINKTRKSSPQTIEFPVSNANAEAGMGLVLNPYW